MNKELCAKIESLLETAVDQLTTDWDSYEISDCKEFSDVIYNLATSLEALRTPVQNPVTSDPVGRRRSLQLDPPDVD